jgi:cytochrome c-type biogenesis protein CcmH
MKWWLLCFLLLLSPAHAVQPDEVLGNPQLESRARALSEGFRCLVCQNQSIDESDASLARDLRILIRERLTKGDSDQQITDFIVARYGDYVLLKPRLNVSTALLWAAPFLIVVVGVGFFLRRRKSVEASAEAPLTKDEQVALLNLPM